MTRHYSTMSLFRQTQNFLLARYFQSHGLFSDFDFSSMKETRPEALFERWLALPDEQRGELDAELREIFEMSCEKGFLAIIDEAEFQLAREPDKKEALVARLSLLPGYYERAMTAFLEHRDLWSGAYRFHHADTITYWRKRKNLPGLPAAVDPESLRKLEQSIALYFHTTEGRGRNCAVEPLRRRDRDYFFCYPEDHSRREIEWMNGKFIRRPHNPAFEVIFVYSQAEGALDLHYTGSYKAIEPLQLIFADTILGLDELPDDPTDDRVYDLSPLSAREFEFTYSAGSGILDVRVTRLRLSSSFRAGERVTLEADSIRDRDAVYMLLDRLKNALPLQKYFVTQVELLATVTVDSMKPPRKMRFRITHPNSCSLKYDPSDLILREMLHASGIEPRTPPPTIEATDGVNR